MNGGGGGAARGEGDGDGGAQDGADWETGGTRAATGEGRYTA